MHVHLAIPSITVQIAFLPQGDNRQGSYGSTGRAAIIFIIDYLKLFKILYYSYVIQDDHRRMLQKNFNLMLYVKFFFNNKINKIFRNL